MGKEQAPLRVHTVPIKYVRWAVGPECVRGMVSRQLKREQARMTIFVAYCLANYVRGHISGAMLLRLLVKRDGIVPARCLNAAMAVKTSPSNLQDT